MCTRLHPSTFTHCKIKKLSRNKLSKSERRERESPSTPIVSPQRLADAPEAVSQFMSVFGLGHLSREHPILQQIENIRVQEPGERQTLGNLFEEFLQSRVRDQAQEQQVQSSHAPQENDIAPQISQSVESEGTS